MRYTPPAKPGVSEPPTAIRLQPSCTAVQLQAPPVNLRVWPAAVLLVAHSVMLSTATNAGQSIEGAAVCLLQVTLTLPTKVDLLETAGLQSPPERTVHWRCFYAKGQRHAVEAMQGNRCALCQMMCLSFTVCGPPGPADHNARQSSAAFRNVSDRAGHQMPGLKRMNTGCRA